MPQYTRRRRKKNRGFKLFAYSAVVVGAILFFAYQQNQLSGQNLTFSNIPTTVATSSEPWTQLEYSLRRKFNITSTTGTIVNYRFNHQELVDLKQSLPDGKDLKVIAQEGAQAHILPHFLEGADSTSATLKFSTAKYPTATFYLYFNSKQDSLEPEVDSALSGQQASDIRANDTEQPSISLVPTRTWLLRYKTGAELEANLKIHDQVWKAGDPIYYVREGEEELRPIDIGDSWVNPTKINLGQVPTGNQGIYIVTQHNGQFFRSPTVYSMISEPMFVAWTIDWDAKSIMDAHLSAINKLSSQFDIPLTQFFNPRIYIDTAIPEFRRGQITNWIRSRQLVNHDELALHLHMYFDLVKAAGITPKTAPHWGSGTDGYDVLTSNYTSEEMQKILKWSLDKLESNGLPKPVGFRAGGWFANLETLKALDAMGFTYDSSGRESYKFGTAELAGPWNLEFTSQPYRPSLVDQNASVPAPVFDLWEIPNNGNDSYWFSGEDMINRFYANYTPGTTLPTQKIVTYLSHPDWFDVDQPKLTKLFLEIDKYTYADDRGPVVYTTLSNALTEWQE